MANNEEMIVPLLPLRGLLVYPTMVLHLDVGRDKSVQALEKAMVDNHLIFLTTQKDLSIDVPIEEDLYQTRNINKSKTNVKASQWYDSSVNRRIKESRNNRIFR